MKCVKSFRVCPSRQNEHGLCSCTMCSKVQGRCFKHYYSATTQRQRGEKATSRRNGKHVFSPHLVRLLPKSDSSCFFQPGVFGVERVHTIPEQEEDLHMKRGKIIFYLSNRNSDGGLWVSLPACCWRRSSLRALRSWLFLQRNGVTGVIAPPAGQRCLQLVLQISGLEVFAALTAAASSGYNNAQTKWQKLCSLHKKNKQLWLHLDR